MVRARRSGVFYVEATGGGGGPPPTPGNVAIGPDYGERSGSDGVTWYVDITVALSDKAALGELTTTVAASLSDWAAAANTAATIAATLPAMAAQGDTSATVAVSSSTDFAGIPPSDDTYLDRGNPDTANGSATALDAQNNTAVINDDENTYIVFDLTNISTGTLEAATITIEVETTNLLSAVVAAFELYTNPTQPLDEATATWNGDEPPPGTLRQSGTFSAPINPALRAITLDATTRANALGNYLTLRITGPDSGLNTTDVIRTTSKEGTTPPSLDMTISAP